MKIIDVLCDQKSLDVSFLNAVLLELGDRFVPCVGFLVICKLNEVIVPLPDGHGVLVEETLGENLSRVRLTSIFLLFLPKAVLASESWDAARCTNSCPSHYDEPPSTNHLGGGLCRSHDFLLVFILLWVSKCYAHLF